jgi:hypothetical protein
MKTRRTKRKINGKWQVRQLARRPGGRCAAVHGAKCTAAVSIMLPLRPLTPTRRARTPLRPHASAPHNAPLPCRPPPGPRGLRGRRHADAGGEAPRGRPSGRDGGDGEGRVQGVRGPGGGVARGVVHVQVGRRGRRDGVLPLRRRREGVHAAVQEPQRRRQGVAAAVPRRAGLLLAGQPQVQQRAHEHARHRRRRPELQLHAAEPGRRRHHQDRRLRGRAARAGQVHRAGQGSRRYLRHRRRRRARGALQARALAGARTSSGRATTGALRGRRARTLRVGRRCSAGGPEEGAQEERGRRRAVCPVACGGIGGRGSGLHIGFLLF